MSSGRRDAIWRGVPPLAVLGKVIFAIIMVVHDYLSKPVVMTSLASTLRRYIADGRTEVGR